MNDNSISQSDNPFYKKKISILGDSISTLQGYQPKEYRVFYEGENCVRSGVTEMSQTWWGQLINLLEAELLVNDSWSGARVTKLACYNTLFPSGCSDERTGNLNVDDVTPDIIIVYLGTNDWVNAVIPNMGQASGEIEPTYVFFNAYEIMLDKLQGNYPNSIIYCCTLNETFMSQNPNFQFPFSVRGIHINVYNDEIRKAALNHGCHVLDLAKYHMPYDSIDGSHPNLNGMKTLAKIMLREMLGEKAEMFDRAEKKHFYKKVVDGILRMIRMNL